ncbi:uncharacterized protein EI90DRAFT_2513479 [Cantharellus anzutake]|uniref:uncharacterized protein n=1 Tax=Cantharellus anzutake TaxID=1750568 RepID=UPI001904B198|nr:uncharacterized protein EI90DRAFT_2513479 [Cantharellus anzutake]KAF8321443.1 hypothetical protein EI90DRAFT_2513479 [Cantharellus anzutake]
MSRFKGQSEHHGLSGLLLARVVPPLSSKPSRLAAWVAVCYNKETVVEDVNAVLRKVSDRLRCFRSVGMPIRDSERVCTFDGLPNQWQISNTTAGISWVTVKKLVVGKPIRIESTGIRTVGEMKDAIKLEWGIPADQQFRLVLTGKHLQEGRLLSDYNVQLESTLVLILRLRGGGMFPFVSIENGSSILDYDRSAPIWRIVQPGLNLQGTCNTTRCPAYNKVTYVPMGIGIFKLHTLDQSDTHGRLLSRCPVCLSDSEMAGMGFMECMWSAWGGKISPTGSIDFFKKQDQLVKPEDKSPVFCITLCSLSLPYQLFIFSSSRQGRNLQHFFHQDRGPV